MGIRTIPSIDLKNTDPISLENSWGKYALIVWCFIPILPILDVEVWKQGGRTNYSTFINLMGFLFLVTYHLVLQLLKYRGREDMEAPGGKINKILKDTNSNFMMDIPVVNDIINNKDLNFIDNEAYIFEEAIQNWKESPISKYYIWVEEKYGVELLLRLDKNIV